MVLTYKSAELMISRALIHVTGPGSAGKTAFIERLLDAQVAHAICVRAVRDATQREERESSPKGHPELRRYRAAGVSGAALYRFAEPSRDAFYSADFMNFLKVHPEAVLIEGDCPTEFVDLSVFVAPVPAKGRALLRRVVRDHTASYQASIAQFAHALENPEALARLFGIQIRLTETAGSNWSPASALKEPRVLNNLRRSVEAELEEARRMPPPAPTEHWALEEDYLGIETAQLVVVNVRSDDDRRAAKPFIEEIARLRKDAEIYRDVIGLQGNKLPITAAIADLSNPKDAGVKKAVARVKRTLEQVEKWGSP